jgi:hypothetical protein
MQSTHLPTPVSAVCFIVLCVRCEVGAWDGGRSALDRCKCAQADSPSKQINGRHWAGLLHIHAEWLFVISTGLHNQAMAALAGMM